MSGTAWLKARAKAALSASTLQWIRRVRRWPPVGRVMFGSLRRVTPIGRRFGYDRGTPVDRYYIENYLERHKDDIRGHVLEVGENTYTRRFGGDRVTRSDVLHVANEGQATIVADLTRADHIPSALFDCIICTQTLQMIYDIRAALRTLRRVLKPGGVLLATTHGISQISPHDMERWGEWWHLTRSSARRLFEEFFPPDHVEVRGYGNVLAVVAMMHGLARQELTLQELDYHDPLYELLITVRAVRPEGNRGAAEGAI